MTIGITVKTSRLYLRLSATVSCLHLAIRVKKTNGNSLKNIDEVIYGYEQEKQSSSNDNAHSLGKLPGFESSAPPSGFQTNSHSLNYTGAESSESCDSDCETYSHTR